MEFVNKIFGPSRQQICQRRAAKHNALKAENTLNNYIENYEYNKVGHDTLEDENCHEN